MARISKGGEGANWKFINFKLGPFTFRSIFLKSCPATVLAVAPPPFYFSRKFLGFCPWNNIKPFLPMC